MLIIGDNITVQDVLPRSLSSLGHNVPLAGNGLVGETLFLISSEAMVIIDLQMPVISFWELLRISEEQSQRCLSPQYRGTVMKSLGGRRIVPACIPQFYTMHAE